MLNDEQLAVVKAGAQPILVLAGAGSGKTRTLVHRVAHLIEIGLDPKLILLLTFTNRAARHMLERVVDLCGPSARAVRGGTFHYVALQLLREHAHCLGYQDNFMIINRDDAKELMNTVTRSHLPKADVLIDMVSYTINTLQPLHEVIYKRFPRFYAIREDIAQVCQAFMEKKLAMNMMDFDDMLMNWKLLLAEHLEIGTQIRANTQSILVDEYQDTNRLQGDIVDLMASEHRHLMVVGDDAQSIYGFRGADVNNMLQFEQRYTDAQRFYLNTNYRSTQRIVSVANISLSKNLISMRHEGERPAVFECPCPNMQAQLVAQRIADRVREGASLSDIAVLYRAHHHAMEVQMELLRRQIPFQLRSGLRFFEQAHMKDVTAYLRLIVNPNDEISFKRVAMLQVGVGKAKAERAWKTRSTSSLREIVTVDVKTRIMNFLDSFYEAYLFQRYTNAEQRRDDVKQLADYARSDVSLETFLNELVLMQDLGQKSDEEQGVTLSSIHQAKGLEWPHVFVIGMGEGKFPSEMSMRETGGIEEERRLFYVAVTRAQDTLALCYHAPFRRSRFIEELSDLEYVHVV